MEVGPTALSKEDGYREMEGLSALF
jgi:hypothetical protein